MGGSDVYCVSTCKKLLKMMKSPSLWISPLEVLVQTGQHLHVFMVTNRQTTTDKVTFLKQITITVGGIYITNFSFRCLRISQKHASGTCN